MLIGSIVLAGGDSERMKQPKASLTWGDASILFDRVEAHMACAFPVVVVARDPGQPLPPLNAEVEFAYDTLPGEGPLVGILAGLMHVEGRCDAAVVVGCDFPFFGPEALHWLAGQLGDHRGVLPMNGDQPQPLCGLYRTSLIPEIRRLVDAGERKAQAIVNLPGVVAIDAATVDGFDSDRRFLWNINTPEDYRQALAWKS